MANVRKIQTGDYVNFRLDPDRLGRVVFGSGLVRGHEIREIEGFKSIVFFVYVHLSGNVYSVPSKNLVF